MENNSVDNFQSDTIQRLTRIEQKVDDYKITLNDHEKRIRFLEKGIWVAVGVIGLLDVFLKFVIK